MYQLLCGELLKAVVNQRGDLSLAALAVHDQLGLLLRFLAVCQLCDGVADQLKDLGDALVEVLLESVVADAAGYPS